MMRNTGEVEFGMAAKKQQSTVLFTIAKGGSNPNVHQQVNGYTIRGIYIPLLWSTILKVSFIQRHGSSWSRDGSQWQLGYMPPCHI